MNDDALITRYRPQTLDDVIGHDAIVKSLRSVIKRGDARVFLFAGPAGTGKTTLARIVAKMMNCSTQDVIEVAAAVKTGVDDMRELQQGLQYKPFGSTGGRAIILDECHRLSKQAWESLLIVTEHPPKHVVLIFCTTEINKVPKAMVTRSAVYNLQPVPEKLISELIDDVCKKEKIKLNGTHDLIVREANGSPRKALSNLAICRDAPDRKTAADLLRTVLESDPTHKLCQFLVSGRATWSAARDLIAALADQEPEGVRIIVCNYVAACLKNAKNEQAAVGLLSILDKFSSPFNPSEGQAPLMLAIGRCIFDR